MHMLLANVKTGIMNETYQQALAFCQSSTRENGIDAALNHQGTQLNALLVPPDVGQTYQIAAQAGRYLTLSNSSNSFLLLFLCRTITDVEKVIL